MTRKLLMRAAAIVTAFSLTLVASCELDRVNVPIRPSQVVVHGVLSATSPTQVILVERTLTGQFAAPNFFQVDSGEPIYSDGGVAERFATVTLTLPNGAVLIAQEKTEDTLLYGTHEGSGHGGGEYIFKTLPGSALVPGGTYALRIVTTGGEIVTAEAIVPEATPVVTGSIVGFNRSTDTMALNWPVTPPAPAYQIRVESPYGAWFAFTDSTRVSLTGELRNVIDANLSRVFIPGFRQGLTISAVDANLFDYYRSANNSFVGSGIISHVHGGLGVFGALVTVARKTVDVTASVARPIEGRFDLIPDPNLGYVYGGVANALTMNLYVESPAVRAKQADAITASYAASPTGARGGAVGTFDGSRLKIFFLRNQVMSDTADGFFGDLHGDTLVGTFRQGAPARYIRR